MVHDWLMPSQWFDGWFVFASIRLANRCLPHMDYGRSMFHGGWWLDSHWWINASWLAWWLGTVNSLMIDWSVVKSLINDRLIGGWWLADRQMVGKCLATVSSSVAQYWDDPHWHPPFKTMSIPTPRQDKFKPPCTHPKPKQIRSFFVLGLWID